MNSHWLPPVIGLLLSPLLLGVINRVKAWFGGRRGQPLLQSYFDISRLLRKGAVYSPTTSWLFRAGPVVTLAALLTLLAITPAAGQGALLSFGGDIVLFCALLATARFFTLLAALDTGSSFEGMGASREALYGALAEPALYLALGALARQTGETSLTAGLDVLSRRHWADVDPVIALVAISMLGVFLIENCRIPVDDPNTHLELTMIHEAMVLDHGGPDLAFIQYAATLRLWVLGSVLAGIVVPAAFRMAWLNLALGIAAILVLAAVVGVIESVIARLRLPIVPHLIAGTGALAATALLLGMR